jgi:hypothetical protein
MKWNQYGLILSSGSVVECGIVYDEFYSTVYNTKVNPDLLGIKWVTNFRIMGGIKGRF